MSFVCPSIQNLGYGAFSELFHTRASQQRIPINGSIELTMRCNLRCAHCYVPLNQRMARGINELTLNEFKRIFSEIAEAGCLWLLFTGGEPLLRPDFTDIYMDAKARGFIISLFTNATMMNDTTADFLAEMRPFSIEVSIYGATEKTYEQVTGIPGSFRKCLRGVEMLLNRGLPVQLKSVLLTINRHERVEMEQLSKHYGLEFRYDPVISAALDGDLYPTKFRLSPEEIIEIEIQDEYRAAAWPKEFDAMHEQEINVPSMYTCGAGRVSFHIDAFGKLSLCLSARQPSYDLRTGNFKTGWEEFIPQVLDLEYPKGFECIGCELRTICAQCPAMGITEMGDPLRVVPFLCQLAKLRHKAFDSITK